MENMKNIINEAAQASQAADNQSSFFKAIEFIKMLQQKMQEQEEAEALTPDFTIDEATDTTKTRIRNITTELQDELDVQRLEVANIKANIDLDVLQNAIERIQVDIQKKREEEKKAAEAATKFRTIGSGLIWRPVFLYCEGLYKGLPENEGWKRELVKSITIALQDRAAEDTVKARLIMSLTECKIRAVGEVDIMKTILDDVVTISKSILDCEKKESVMNGQPQLKMITDALTAWIGINF